MGDDWDNEPDHHERRFHAPSSLPTEENLNMKTASPLVAALALTLTLAGAARAETPAEAQSDKLLDQAAFAESQDSTQVKEEEAVEQKDGMTAPADNAAGATDTNAQGSAGNTPAAPAAPN